jgi:uncharacterized protein (TIGR00730 family)
MNRIAVFCGSNQGRSPRYGEGARSLGRALAARGIDLVFGGTGKGLMKIVADAVVEGGGVVHGVIPRSLVDKGQRYAQLTRADVVDTRSLRKRRMAELADAFNAMPGGLGTLEELFEMWVDAQFDGHEKPLGLLNVDGFFGGLLGFIDTMIAEGFLPPQHRSMIVADTDPDRLLDAFEAFAPVTASKWM